MKIAIAQLNSVDDIAQNLRQVIKLTETQTPESAEIIFFPENTLYFRINPEEAVKALPLHGPEMDQLKSLCRRSGIAIHFTTAIEDSGKVYNASVLIDAQQNVELLYRKMHLFDIELEGQKPIRESDVFAHGQETHIFEFGGFKFGSAICYDLRFAELFAKYARQEVDAILIPSAFLVKTGQAHWEVLLRARAIESQCYVVAAAQAGEHKSARLHMSRETFGHASFVNPWGTVVAQKPSGVGLLHCSLDKGEIRSARQQIPMRNHRKIEI